jgi:hypothetical protein
MTRPVRVLAASAVTCSDAFSAPSGRIPRLACQVQGFLTVRLVKRSKSLVLRVMTVMSW